ncbi:MAG: Methionine aminopeptidase [uncultured bacterium]|nr:MAG: Methionine aminopeptidase [uncultured bacterium]HCU70239.1 type I methionyl aminopeptidase [Candidatus Moranbacteria bacterium]
MIIIKSEKEIEAMREGGKILADIMEKVGAQVFPGKNTFEIDALAEKLIIEAGGKPVFKGYGKESGNPFPGTICASINQEIVHGIPSKNVILKEGDILKIDIGMRYKGMITDMARTWAVGKISEEAQKLLDVTRESLNIGIGKLRAKGQLSKYSCAVEDHAKKFGFSPVRDLVGHGVGKKLHEDPHIPNYKSKEDDVKLKEGMTLAFEPMINAGKPEIKLGEDGWTYVTRDGKLSAHFEDTVLITKGGVEILTRK